MALEIHKYVAAGIGGIIILFAAFVLINGFVVAPKRMKIFCEEEVRIDTSIDRVKLQARQRGFRWTTLAKETPPVLVIHDSDSMGRWLCEVQYQDKTVTGKRYVHND
jgi:hypothetical protein